MENYFLNPGFVYVPQEPSVVSAVVGSAVCVCIYDRKRACGGMCHFQYPLITDKGKTTPCYGNVAIYCFLRMLFSQGSKKKHLEAQIFGGAWNREHANRDIGRENINQAKKDLMKYSILLASEDVGGEKGRKLVFHTRSNEIAVLKVDNLRSDDWYPYEKTR
nr:chemotaxis protein CheD [Desulfobacter curvatus]